MQGQAGAAVTVHRGFGAPLREVGSLVLASGDYLRQTAEINNADQVEQRLAWMRQWRTAEVALTEEKRRELSEMTEAEAARSVREVLPEPDYERLAREEVDPTSGLLEQQRLFHLKRS